jgi:hypothetical protein
MPDPLFNMSLKTRRAGLSSHPVDPDEWLCVARGLVCPRYNAPCQRLLT